MANPQAEEEAKMESVERLVVQISESNRLLCQGGVARWRISLMLLDNTAELLLRRECNSKLALNYLGRQLYEEVREAMHRGETHQATSPRAAPGQTPRKLADIEAELKRQTVTEKEQSEIVGKFVPKVLYLQRNKLFSESHAAVLTRLHRYRNEIYHEDKVRPATIETAAKIYTYVVCDLMKRLTSLPEPIEIGAVTAELDALYPGERHHSHKLSSYAESLLAQSPIDAPEKLAEALSEHLLDRLEKLDHDLTYVASNGGDDRQIVGEQTRDRTLKAIFSRSAETKKVKYSKVRQWKGMARNLVRATDYVNAFEKFATAEVELEVIEDEVLHAVRLIDQPAADIELWI
ncbi:hypothetical protein [Rhodococcus sp. RS1C4]|nr:hypothetical protein [Rhodococcus sp. RS1C4]